MAKKSRLGRMTTPVGGPAAIDVAGETAVIARPLSGETAVIARGEAGALQRAVAGTITQPRYDLATPRQPRPGPDTGAPEIHVTGHRLAGFPDPRLALLVDPDSPRAASFRVLRHHLADAGAPQVVLVSSAREGEGKTTCAVNLALALAESGHARVLLLEANARRPALAHLFGFAPPWCATEQLAGRRDGRHRLWSVVELEGTGLHIAAVHPTGRRQRLESPPGLLAAVQQLRAGGYDHIIIDTPPVLGSADVNMVQDAADGVILTVRRKRSSGHELRQVVQQLTPARLLGTVLVSG